MRTSASCALLYIAASLTLVAPRSIHAQPSASPGGEKTAEQVKKNIQVLKGLPASQFSAVMDFVASSLGVRCSHCHVQDSTGWQYDSDDKQSKRTARKMMQMVMDINAKTFAGSPDVNCYTCHRGSTEPIKMIPIPQPPVIGGREQAPPVAELPPADKILAMVESALGGADALTKVTSRISKGITVDGQGREQEIEITQQVPDKYLMEVSMKDRGSFIRCLNGTSGWMSGPRGSRELPPGEVEMLKEEAQLFPLARIRQLASTLHVKEKITLNGAACYVLESPAGTHDVQRYYIDSANGLLLRSMTISQTMLGDIPEQTEYSDYRPVGPVKVPFMVKSATVDPRDTATRKFTSVEQNVPIDEKKFQMPKKQSGGK